MSWKVYQTLQHCKVVYNTVTQDCATNLSQLQSFYLENHAKTAELLQLCYNVIYMGTCSGSLNNFQMQMFVTTAGTLLLIVLQCIENSGISVLRKNTLLLL